MELNNSVYSWKNLSLKEFLEEGNIPSGWIDFFSDDNVKKELWKISEYLDKIRNTKIIYPSIHKVFKAFYLTPFDKMKVILISQDPYHNGTNEFDGSACGLCFSVANGNSINPSLKNINKELVNSGYSAKEDGNLTEWAKQGVLLLNMALTVEKGDPESHSLIWYNFSKMLIQYITKNNNVKWLLFGSHAHTCIKDCDNIKEENVFRTTHPSPLGASKASKTAVAFLGSKVFSKIKEVKW
jgi:uracil-DNA glycosylase